MQNDKKEKKDGVRTNFFLERQILDDLNEYCERTGRTKTRVAETAIKEFLERHKEDDSL